MVTIPEWAKGWLAETTARDVEQAIVAAESRTRAEIVPMIVRSSSAVGHTPWLLSAYLLAIFLATDAFFDYRQWTGSYPLLLAAFMLIVFSLSFVLSRYPFFQRLALSDADRDGQVNRRAELEFFEAGLQKTEGRTGILLFVSLMEHRAVVIADKTIAERVPQETWADVVAILVEGAREKRLDQAFAKAIEACGDIVAPHFPRQPDDKNELFDHLILKD